MEKADNETKGRISAKRKAQNGDKEWGEMEKQLSYLLFTIYYLRLKVCDGGEG